MASNPIQNNDGTEEQQDVSFSVMPHGNIGDYVSSQMKSAPIPKQPQAPMQVANEEPQVSPNDMPMDHGLPTEHHAGLFQRKSTYVVLGTLILIILVAAAYFLLGPSKDTEGPDPSATKLPRVYLMQHFNVAECTNITLCGDDADPDQDGLNNYDEFVEQTIPTKNDTDDDGLADGDEVHIYQINPLKKYTDPRPIAEQSGYTDGSQIKNQYDPLTPGQKMTQVRINQIESDIKSFGLHMPTTMTLTSPEPPQSKTVTIFITNNKFDSANVVINVNDSVVWLNKDITPHQIASDPHPTHTLLPELESGSLATNQTFSLKFTKAGKYGYHDHLNPTIKGMIEVK